VIDPLPCDLAPGDLAQITQALASLCPHWHEDAYQIEKYLNGGYQNRNYLLRHQNEHFVLRLMATGSTTQAALTLEVARLTLLADADGVLVPEVVAVRPQSGLLLTRFCDWPLLAATPGVSAESLGEYLAGLHQQLSLFAAADAVRTATGDDLRVAHGESGARALLKQLPVSRRSLAPCHLDLNPWNLLRARCSGAHDVTPRWLTLDWESLALADPMFDLVTLCDGYLREQGLLDRAPEFSESALQHYQHQQEALQAESRRDQRSKRWGAEDLTQARRWFRIREYAWAARQLALGNDRPEIIAQRDDYAALLDADGILIPDSVDTIERT